MKIEIHILQTFGVNRMNSDRDGQPKSIEFGGFTRSRFSSQSMKRAARMYTHESELLPKDQWVTRTRHLTEMVASELIAFGIEKVEAPILTVKALSALGLNNKKSDTDEETLLSEYLILCSDREVKSFADAIMANLEFLRKLEMTPIEPEPQEGSISLDEEKPMKSKKNSKKKKKELFPPEIKKAFSSAFITQRTIELALYGRHLADFPAGSVDGQVQVGHAISVHQSLRENDFFVAIDDYASAHEAQAGMLGDVGVTAPTMYRVASVNVSQLAKEVGSAEAAKLGVMAFLEAFTLSQPSGGHNSYFATTAPTFVLFREVIQGVPLTLAPAFADPIVTRRNQSLADLAVARMDEYIHKTELAFPTIKRGKQICINLSNYEFRSSKKVKNLNEAIKYMLSDFVVTP